MKQLTALLLIALGWFIVAILVNTSIAEGNYYFDLGVSMGFLATYHIVLAIERIR